MPLSISHELVRHAEGRLFSDTRGNTEDFPVTCFTTNQFCQKADETQTTCEARDVPSRKQILGGNNMRNVVSNIF